jgi:hypothetical protein
LLLMFCASYCHHHMHTEWMINSFHPIMAHWLL